MTQSAITVSMETNRFLTGLVSISFRKNSWQEVLEYSKKAGIEGIEWGGDVHVPHGEREIAEEVGKATREAGLKVAAYGSYYRLGFSRHEGLPFRDVVTSAQALQAPVIRVWAGKKGSAEFTDEEYQELVTEAREIAELAGTHGIRVALEFHRNTQTDSAKETVRFLRDVNHPNLKTLWQPAIGLTPAERLAELALILPWLEHLHVFHWQETERRPLSEGQTDWLPYLKTVAVAGKACFCLLEFVREDRPEQLVEDVSALKDWIQKVEFSLTHE